MERKLDPLLDSLRHSNALFTMLFIFCLVHLLSHMEQKVDEDVGKVISGVHPMVALLV
jgi:hypothetical protein